LLVGPNNKIVRGKSLALSLLLAGSMKRMTPKEDDSRPRSLPEPGWRGQGRGVRRFLGFFAGMEASSRQALSKNPETGEVG